VSQAGYGPVFNQDEDRTIRTVKISSPIQTPGSAFNWCSHGFIVSDV